jgi:heptosyltransferase-1
MKVPDFSKIRSVLVIKPSSLGDVVHTLPAVHRLKLTFPHLRIDWLVNPEWSPLLEGNPDLVETVIFPRGKFKGKGGWSRYRAWMKDFKWRPPPHVVLDFQGLLRSAWIARQSGAQCVVGLSDSREGARWFHHVRVPVNATDHAVDRYLKLVDACGARSGPVQFPMPLGNLPEGRCPAGFCSAASVLPRRK